MAEANLKDLETFRDHAALQAVRYLIAHRNAHGVIVRVPQVEDACPTGYLDHCAVKEVPVYRGTKIILAE